MLRRRKRAARGPKPEAGNTPPKPGARRRARQGAAVPRELTLSHAPQPQAPPKAPQASRPRANGVVLVTGFDPFGGEKTNPSWDVCKRLPDEIAGMRVERCLVPCEFRRAIEVAAEAIERTHPALVVCLGQAGGRSRIGVERVAIN